MAGQNRLVQSMLEKGSESALTAGLMNSNEVAAKKDKEKKSGGKKKKK
jgi:hypothetical protein